MNRATTDLSVAATARSILACPAAADLAVDGLSHPLEDDQRLALDDRDGTPSFLCLPGGVLAAAAAEQRRVLLSVSSGLRPAAEWDLLTLAGGLRLVSSESCDCCREPRERVVVDVTFAVLSRGDGSDRFRVDLDEFRAPEHRLNRGYLQRSAQHAEDHHQDELRRAVAALTSTRPGDVLGVRLSSLSADGAEVTWVDRDGAHQRRLPFPHAARSTEELGRLLRSQLHPGIC